MTQPKRPDGDAPDFLRISLTKSVSAEAAEALDRQYFDECLCPLLLTCTDADPDTYPSIVRSVRRLLKSMGEHNKPLIIIGSPPELMGRIHQLGTHSMLGFAATEADALELVERLQADPNWGGRSAAAKEDKAEPAETAAEPKKSSLQVNMINPFLNSTMKLVKLQGGGEVRVGTPGLRDKDAPLSGDISGIIPISGRDCRGSVVLSFPEKTLQGLLKKMLGSSADVSPEDLKDGASEILNMIFTRGKAELNEQGHAVTSAIPEILPNDIQSRRQKISGRVAISFDSDLGSFTIEIWTEAA